MGCNELTFRKISGLKRSFYQQIINIHAREMIFSKIIHSVVLALLEFVQAPSIASYDNFTYVT